MLGPALRPSSGVSIEKYYKDRYIIKSKWPLVYSPIFYNVKQNIKYRIKGYKADIYIHTNSRVSICDGSFYDDSLLRHLSSRAAHSRLVAHHCRNSSALPLLSALLALFRCARVTSFSILVQFFRVDCDFSKHDVRKKKEEEKIKVKTVDVTLFLDVF